MKRTPVRPQGLLSLLAPLAVLAVLVVSGGGNAFASSHGSPSSAQFFPPTGSASRPQQTNWTYITSNSTAEPVTNISPMVPSVAGGSWSQVTGLWPLSGGTTFALGVDNGTGLPKTGLLSSGKLADTSATAYGPLSKSDLANLAAYHAFSGSLLSGSTSSVLLWNGAFSGLTGSPLVIEMNSSGTAQKLLPPSGLASLSGGATSNNFTLLLGTDAVLAPEYIAYNSTLGFVNVSRYVPSTWGTPSGLLGTRSGVLLATNSSGNTLGLLYPSAGTWVLRNLSADLPATSSFTSPVSLWAANGPWVLLSTTVNLTSVTVFGMLNLQTGAFANVTAAATTLGLPTAASADSRTTTNFTLASPGGILELDAATSVAQTLSAAAWTSATVPESLAWSGTTLLVGGYRVQNGGFLGSWSGSGPIVLSSLPSGITSVGSLSYGSGVAWLGGNNGTEGAGLLYNLSTHSSVSVGSLLPTGFDNPVASTIHGSNLFVANQSLILEIPLTGGSVTRLALIPNAAVSVLAWVNGTLWAGGTQGGSAALLQSYDFATSSWTSQSAGLLSPAYAITALVPSSPTSALVWGESSNLSGLAWFFNASAFSPFQNISGFFGSTIPLVAQSQAAWNGSAFWIYDGKGVETWVPGSATPGNPLLIPPSPIYVTSLAVDGEALLLGGFSGTTLVNLSHPLVFIGYPGSTLTNLTPMLGSSWVGTPFTLFAGSAFLFGSTLVNGTLSLFTTAPPLGASMFANAPEAEIPFDFQFLLSYFGGATPYAAPRWSTPGYASQNGSSSSFTFTTTGYQNVHNITATLSDASGTSLVLEGGVYTFGHVNLSLNAPTVSGYAPLNVSFSWTTTGGSASYNPVTATYGDGPVATNLPDNGTITHEYANPGNYTAIFTVNDSFGYSARATLSISVLKPSTPPPPPPKNNTTSNNTTKKTTPPPSGGSGLSGAELGIIVTVAVIGGAAVVLAVLYFYRKRRALGNAPKSGGRSRTPGSSRWR